MWIAGSRMAQYKIQGLAPKIEAAKVRADFVSGEQRERFGDYLSEPENARLLFDPAVSPDRGCGGAAG